MVRNILATILLFAASTAVGQDQHSGGTREFPLSGVVYDDNGPIHGAVVRIQTTEYNTTTDEQGQFTLSGRNEIGPTVITAWFPGYYIKAVEPKINSGIKIHLEPHTATDNPDYAWLPSTMHPGEGENQGCGECHSSQKEDSPFELPVDQWLQDSHSRTATNPIFLTMYRGRDMAGNQSPPTRYANSRDYGVFPLPPDPDKPYYGPGYKVDFPDTAGNCAACHTPLAAIDDPYGVDPTALGGTLAEGVSCDFCHKIWDVHLDDSGLPVANMPGVLSFEFRRPGKERQLFFGPLDDVAPGDDAFSPIQRKSQICAPCHFGVFWQTVVYNSFGEWLDSPYSEPESGQTCQDCHMPNTGATHIAHADKGGLRRSLDTASNHRMPGAGDVTLLQNAVTMVVVAEVSENQVAVEVTISNDKTGHHVPTDSPLRQMILLVDAVDAKGNRLVQNYGPTVPMWGGTGNPEEGYYAGTPGTAYAKILQELWTEVYPSGAYWNPTRVISDNRIPAMRSDTTRYGFMMTGDSGTAAVSISAKLLFRRAFIKLMDQKGWEIDDILMEEQYIEVSG